MSQSEALVSQEAPTSGVSDLILLNRAPELYPAIFPSPQSLGWFVRVNRQLLIERGALLVIAGRNTLHRPKFEAAILEIGQRCAKGAA